VGCIRAPKRQRNKKTRPALIISPKSYNLKTGFVLCMPITSKVKGYLFEVIVNDALVSGAVLSDQYALLIGYQENQFLLPVAMQM
jgi:mRNA-degrading endonuclease toxin of MazEF toxin-antitoxin module